MRQLCSRGPMKGFDGFGTTRHCRIHRTAKTMMKQCSMREAVMICCRDAGDVVVDAPWLKKSDDCQHNNIV